MSQFSILFSYFMLHCTNKAQDIGITESFWLRKNEIWILRDHSIFYTNSIRRETLSLSEINTTSLNANSNLKGIIDAWSSADATARGSPFSFLWAAHHLPDTEINKTVYTYTWRHLGQYTWLDVIPCSNCKYVGSTKHRRHPCLGCPLIVCTIHV